MRLIPPLVGEDTRSEGERFVFAALQERARGAAPRAATDTSGWTVLHSLDIAHHRRQVQGEADFVVIAPGLGVLVLEVKGCRHLHRSGGLWYYGGDTQGDPRGPFRQAAEAAHSLRKRLTGKRPHLSGVPFASAVCFPFLTFDQASEEWQPWQVVDERRLGVRHLVDCLAAVLRQAREAFADSRPGWFDPAAGEPTPGQCEEIVAALRPDFEFYESPKARARRVDEEIRRYTEEQFAALDHMARTPRVVFDGPAGTGKTLLAIETARRACRQLAAAGQRRRQEAADGSGDAGRVGLLCFNRPLAVWLRDQVADLPGVRVATLHEYMRELAAEVDPVKADPPDDADDSYWNVLLPELAGEALLARDEPPFRVLVVDEAQDVVREPYRDVLDLSVAGGLREGTWRFFGDFANQAIYDDSVSLDGFCAAVGGGCAVYELAENCRNTPRVADLAVTYGAVPQPYRKVLRPDDGVAPTLRFYASAGEQERLLAEVLAGLREEGFGGPQVVVLSTRGDAASAAGRLVAGGDPVWARRLRPLVAPGTHEVDLSASGGAVRYCSVHRFKGLEARAVVLTDVERLATPHERSLLYVGATRATQRLVVLAHRSLRKVLGGAGGGATGGRRQACSRMGPRQSRDERDE